VLIYIILWIAASLIVAAAAASRGRNGLAWLFYGLLAWPLALLNLMVLPKTDARLAHEAKVQAMAGGRQPCPHCAEPVLPAARICPHCKSELQQALTVDARSA
jgi:hypothetical protein